MFRVNQITFMTGCWAAAGGRADYVFWLIAAVSASATEPRAVSSPQSSHYSLKRRLSECSRRFHNHGEGPYYGLLLVDSAYKHFHIEDTIKTLC